MFPFPFPLPIPPSPSALLIEALNRLLARNPWAREHLAPFAGRPVRVAIGGWTTAFALAPTGRLSEAPTPAEAAVYLELPLSALPSLVEGPDALLRQARIAGEAHFAETLGFVLRRLEWDFEEDLAALTGDPIAHRLCRLGRGAAAQIRESGRRLGGNLAEYLREEAGLLPAQSEFDAFRAELQALERDLRCTDERLSRLPHATF